VTGKAFRFLMMTTSLAANVVAVPAAAADWPLVPKAPATGPAFATIQPIPSYEIELGGRYWFGWAKTGKDLHGTDGSLVSRLTYGGLNTHAGEIYGRADTTMGFFIKGNVGAGSFTNGTLIDEDFPPGISPYSRTTSDDKGSYLRYATIDVGADLLRGSNYRLGVFAGYNYLGESVSAYGCGQIAANPFVCEGGAPGNLLVITQQNNWNSLRVGGSAEIRYDRLKLGLDAAWLPYVMLNGTDTHWLRIGSNPGDFTGPLPEDGTGTGYQLEAVLSYRVNEMLDVGVGGRYWHMQASGNTHFEGHIVGFQAAPQPVDWQTDHYGVFVQAGLKLGPYPIGSK
jgi:outer membrane protease